jgi:beta-glucosidase-like glycosyl hydrolase/CubicO group peptidase (beta-lactamase class C family)
VTLIIFYPLFATMKKIWIIIACCFILASSFTNNNGDPVANAWADSVFKTLSKEEKIAQLMVVRAHSNLGPDHLQQVAYLIQKYNVGALCWFQGGPVRQANLTNYYQSIAKTPLMMTMDAEWGLGMRLDSVDRFPYQLTLGALSNDQLVYEMGEAIGEQCRRIGVHVNYAPVVDVNNNPDNPVIGYRSFGQDKFKVAKFGVAYMKGLQDAGVLACAKHFPGHGDVDVDSHLDLPVINKSMDQLNALELYPFKEMFAAGVGSVMIAHLSIPAIDSTTNLPTSLSKKNVTDLLRDEMDYKGLTFTDALEMKGVSKYFPAGEAAVQALIAGNDMLCLPEDVPAAIEAIEKAIKEKRLRQKDIDGKVKKILLTKYHLGLNHPQFVDPTNLLADLNGKTDAIRAQVARNTITVINNNTHLLPIMNTRHIAYVGIGADSTAFGNRLKNELNADAYYLNYEDSDDRALQILDAIRANKYNKIIVGVHNYALKPANNYGISATAIGLWDSLQTRAMVGFVFGNVYATKNFLKAPTLIAMYQDDEITQNVAVDFIEGKLASNGKLPVTIDNTSFGTGIAIRRFFATGVSPAWLAIDSIVRDGMARKAFPGAQVLAIQNGDIKYHKAFGHYEYDPKSLPVSLESIYDLASVTKISATTVSIMKLYEEGKIDIKGTLGDYLPSMRGSNKENLKLTDIMLHQAGLPAGINFWGKTLDPRTKRPSADYYSDVAKSGFTIPVASGLYLRNDWEDTMMQMIADAPLGMKGKYVYSDLDFILLGKIIEAVTGMPLDVYVHKVFYEPLGMTTTGFKPFVHFGVERIVPTEEDTYFRRQLMRGYVHDESAAMFGNVSGNAGLFSNAYDLSLLFQMLANGGELNGKRYLKKETIDLFNQYHSNISRRGYGFDKPEKDNAKRREPYPSALASAETFGHTGFTGTCVWVDPESKLVYIFLSNRVFEDRDTNLLGRLNIRGKIQDAIYKALQKEETEKSVSNQVLSDNTF